MTIAWWCLLQTPMQFDEDELKLIIYCILFKYVNFFNFFYHNCTISHNWLFVLRNFQSLSTCILLLLSLSWSRGRLGCWSWWELTWFKTLCNLDPETKRSGKMRRRSLRVWNIYSSYVCGLKAKMKASAVLIYVYRNILHLKDSHAVQKSMAWNLMRNEKGQWSHS